MAGETKQPRAAFLAVSHVSPPSTVLCHSDVGLPNGWPGLLSVTFLILQALAAA